MTSPPRTASFETTGLTRRTALVGGAALSTLPFAARAQGAADLKGTNIVFTSWGGAYQDAERVSYCEPFEKATGAKVVQDGPVNNAKFRAMIESGSPDWDVVDTTGGFLAAGSKEGLFEKIDPQLVTTSRIDPRFAHEYGLACIVWSNNLAYNSATFTGDNVPKTWADMFDLKKFPGKRTLLDQPGSSLEIALLADGVAPDKLYPLDVERALKKLDTIKEHTIFWTTNSQSQQLFVDREVAVGMILNGRAYDAAKKGAKIAVSWEQNLQQLDYLVVPRGSRNRAAAMRLLDTATVAENQAKLANLIDEPLSLLYNMTGLFAGSVQVLLPLVIFPLYSAMARIDPSFMQAAMTLGARPARAFTRVYMPLTLPGLMTGATLVFISMLGYYITPALLGGPHEQMISQLIQTQIAEFGNWGMAGALSLILLAVTGGLLLLLQATVGLKAITR
jgi:putative spermidine/putrescine transport system substrate-binding protein